METTKKIPPSPNNVDMDSMSRTFMPRLIEHNSMKEPILGVEVMDGKYKGVVYSYDELRVVDKPGVEIPDGMQGVSFKTEVYNAPEGFVADEEWGNFAGAVLVTWLVNINTDALTELMTVPTKGIH